MKTFASVGWKTPYIFLQHYHGFENMVLGPLVPCPPSGFTIEALHIYFQINCVNQVSNQEEKNTQVFRDERTLMQEVGTWITNLQMEELESQQETVR